MIKILIVEDDKVIGHEIKKELETYSYEVFLVKNFERILEEVNEVKPDLILMDLILPINNGYFYCQEIRKTSNAPIIFISSKSEDMDMVMAMQFGADDYIKKPVNLTVVSAKVNAMLRRVHKFNNSFHELTYGDYKLSISRYKFIYHEREISLTKTECIILESLFYEKGNIVSRETIMDKCWQGDDFIDDNTLSVNLTRIRQKLKTIGVEGLIESKRGKGYYLNG